MSLHIEHLSFSYQENKILVDVDLQLNKGEIGVIIGRSGEGKSTLLKLIAGLLSPKTGKILWQYNQIERPETKLIPGDERVRYVAQDFDLMPFISAAENIHQGAMHLLDEEKIAFAAELLQVFMISDLANQKARTLSGGEQQRIALAKALASHAELFLFDEVFSQLDLATKQEVLWRLKKHIKKHNKTAVFVLHEPLDAFFLADKVFVLEDHHLIQQGEIKEVFHNPVNSKVAQLFGHVNKLPLAKFSKIFSDTKPINLEGNFVWFTPKDVSLNDVNTQYKIVDEIFLGSETVLIIEVLGEVIWISH